MHELSSVAFWVIGPYAVVAQRLAEITKMVNAGEGSIFVKFSGRHASIAERQELANMIMRFWL